MVAHKHYLRDYDGDEYMIKNNRVSLWLGRFPSKEELDGYMDVEYDEDGNQLQSSFQRDFRIIKYDMDAIEVDWIENEVNDVQSLLMGSSGDDEIIPRFEIILENKEINNYNSIVLLYNYEYDSSILSSERLDYVGCVDIFNI